jgi:poly(hydroxyalkanoate) depolymerase family esterase
MNAFSKIDMREVARLTQAGRLGEALALIKRLTQSVSPTNPSPADSGADAIPRRLPEIGEAAPSRKARTSLIQNGRPTDSAEPAFDFAPAMRALRDRLPPSAWAFRKQAKQPEVSVPKGARYEQRVFANAAGSRTYKVYVPSGYHGQALPVVLMLHGCTQTPDDFAVGTRMNEVAEERGLIVAYPHQPRSANAKNCWNWFNTEEQQRDGGEPSLIAGIASQIVEEFSADPTRVYVAGLSAGGAAAAILAKTYPDIFAAVGVHSGLACGAAKDLASALAAMGGGATPPVGGGPSAPTIVFHGDADRIVNPVNGDHVAAQAMQGETLFPVVTRGETPAGVAYTRKVERDGKGREVLEQWILHGAGHAWSGGSPDGSYTDERGPDASREMVRFFLRHANVRRGAPV